MAPAGQGQDTNGTWQGRVGTLEAQQATDRVDTRSKLDKLADFGMDLGERMVAQDKKQGDRMAEQDKKQGERMAEQDQRLGQRIVEQDQRLGQRITEQGEQTANSLRSMGFTVGQNRARLDNHDNQLAERPTYHEVEESAKKLISESEQKIKADILDSISKMPVFSDSNSKKTPVGPTPPKFSAVSTKVLESEEEDDDDTKLSPVSLDKNRSGPAGSGQVRLKAAPSSTGTPQKHSTVRFAPNVAVKYHKQVLSPGVKPMYHDVPIALGSPIEDGVEPLSTREPAAYEQPPEMSKEESIRRLRLHGMTKKEIRTRVSHIRAADQMEQLELEDSKLADLEEEERLSVDLPWNWQRTAGGSATDEVDPESAGEEDDGGHLDAAEEEGGSPRSTESAGDEDDGDRLDAAEEEGESPRSAKRLKTSNNQSFVGKFSGLFWGSKEN